METSQGVKFATPIIAQNVQVGRTYTMQGGSVAMTVLYITPGFHLTQGGSTISLHRKARVRLADGRVVVGRFWRNQRYFEYKGE
jgi:hypothetical protein